ncbi:MAG: hypothetical protein CMH30_09545 [Micavibrio sp.]|nr:hypothetical protein [Micavibrio sp.]
MKTPVFIHIPKTAGKSVRKALEDVPNLIDIKHSTIDIQRKQYRKRGKEFPEDIFSFCFVRNPYKRLMSSFYHLSEVSDVAQTSFTQNRRKLREEYKLNFQNFVMDKGFEKYDFGHFKHQTRWLLDENGLEVVDSIGRFEYLQQDFSKLYFYLSGKSGVILPKINKTISKNYSDDFLTSWDEKMLSLVAGYYKKDFEYLGYSYDIKDAASLPKGDIYDTL